MALNYCYFTFQAKVRARLSRPLQRGKGKHVIRGDFRSGRGSGRVVRSSWGRPLPPRSLPIRGVRGIGSRVPPASMKRPGGLRDRRPVVSMPTRGRPLPPPARSYERRAPGMLIFMHLIGCRMPFFLYE